LFYCFGCGAGGDAIRLHMQASGDDFPAAIETLARANGIPLPASSRSARSGPDPEEILGAAADLYQAELPKSRKAAAYLASRRIPDPVVKRFGVGYAPDSYDFVIGALRSRFRVQDLELALGGADGGGAEAGGAVKAGLMRPRGGACVGPGGAFEAEARP
jgi:DNA primase